jgi:two-component system OmpR family response regulator
MHVLILENDPDVSKMLLEFLRREGHTAEEARTCAAAGAAVARGGVDVLLADRILDNGEDGLEFAADVAAEHLDLRVILMSGSGCAGNAAWRRVDLVRFCFISKPFTLDQLSARLFQRGAVRA